MNSLERHHRDSIRFGYRCFDRMLLNAVIQHLQLPEAIFGFFKRQRHVDPVTPGFLKYISSRYHTWLERKAEQRGIPVVQPPKDVRRDEWVEPYFQRLGGSNGVAVILKAREPVKMAVSSRSNWVDLVWRNPYVYNLYLQHPQCGRMFLRLCPYFPFNARVCLNGHEWLAQRLRQEGIAFSQRDNAFVDCADPKRLQELADAFSPNDVVAVVDELFAQWLPYFSPQERERGYRHRPFLAQVEYCDNLIFHKKAALHRLFDRLLDLNRAIGQPAKLAVIFGRQRFRADTRTGKTEIKITRLGLPVLRAGFKSTSLKQYVRDGVLLRTETTSHQLKDLSLRKDVRHLPRVRQVFAQSNERFLNAEQDVLETYVDRGQLEQLRQPTVSPTGRRTPGLRLDDVRVLAVWQALTGIVHLVGHGTFRTKDLLESVQRTLNRPDYKLSQLRYDLGKLRGKGLVERVAGSQQYRLTATGYRVGVLYCKLYNRLYAPMTASQLAPSAADHWLGHRRRSLLDRLYTALDTALHRLSHHVGLRDSA